MTLTLLLCGCLGMLGGLANSLLLENGFALPRIVLLEGGKRVWNPGFIGNLILGAIAALVVFMLGGSALPSLNAFGVSIVSGIGGGNLLTSIVQKYETNILKTQMEGLEQALKAATGGAARTL